MTPRILAALLVASVLAGFAGADEPSKLEPFPLSMAELELTRPTAGLAVHGPAPVVCGADGRVYVVDRAAFTVLRFDGGGRARGKLTYDRRTPTGCVNLPSSVAAKDALYLPSPDGEVVLRLPFDGSPSSWLGLAEGGITFLKAPVACAPALAPATVAVWDPALRMVVTLTGEGRIVASEKGTGMTPWTLTDGSALSVVEQSGGGWRLQNASATYSAQVPARLAGRRVLSCEVVGRAPAGGWVMHHFLGDSDLPAALGLRWLDRDGKVVGEKAMSFAAGQSLPPPPGCSTDPGGRVWFVSGELQHTTLRVVERE